MKRGEFEHGADIPTFEHATKRNTGVKNEVLGAKKKYPLYPEPFWA